MSNHVHYLLQPKDKEDLPKIMHFINWYTAMCFNRILHRKGHFWEQRYYSTAFHQDDKQRALNTLRYIHANPKAVGVRKGFFYPIRIKLRPIFQLYRNFSPFGKG